MKRTLRWGILATGNIAGTFARGLPFSKTGELVAVGSRSQEKAEAFCREHGGKPYGSYEGVLADPNVDAVYIATPHHTHMDDTIAAARAGKAILCEKPFTLNSLEAERALVEVDKAGVFFMEAFMYRCTPQTAKIREWLAAGLIGEVQLVNAEFAFQGPAQWTNFRNDPNVGGGGLMDVGCYCVSLSLMAFDEDPQDTRYVSMRSPSGVDWVGSGQLVFSRNRSAVFTSGVGIVCRNEAAIYGEKGRITIEDPWIQRKGALLRRFERNELVETLDLGMSKPELYGYEADVVAAYLDAKECPFQSKADTVRQMRTLDRLRASANLTFAAETLA